VLVLEQMTLVGPARSGMLLCWQPVSRKGECAHLAGIDSIGYANKPGKFERMTAAHAGAVITFLSALAFRLRTHRLT
jgi:hypothetical protein